MRLSWCAALLCVVSVVAPARAEEGVASVYHYGPVACPGFKFSLDHLIAAHKTLPCGSRAEVTNKANGRRIVVTIVDRGPYKHGRIIDLTPAGADRLGFGNGLANVVVTPINRSVE